VNHSSPAGRPAAIRLAFRLSRHASPGGQYTPPRILPGQAVAGVPAARFPLQADADVLGVDEGSVLTSAGLAAGSICASSWPQRLRHAAAVGAARRMVLAAHREGGQAQCSNAPC
jgi:hypothetical protein